MDRLLWFTSAGLITLCRETQSDIQLTNKVTNQGYIGVDSQSSRSGDSQSLKKVS